MKPIDLAELGMDLSIAEKEPMRAMDIILPELEVAGNVAYWPKCEVPTAPGNVRC
jgi:hypothetical protein